MIAPSAAELDRGYLGMAAAVNEVLGIVAPHEIPAGSPRPWVSFRELGIDRGPAVQWGFAAPGLDRIVARQRRDDSIIGRPMFAIALESLAAARAHVAGDDRLVIRWRAARQHAATLACHEYAHAVLIARDESEADLAFTLDMIGTALVVSETLPLCHGHDPQWWKLYCITMARAAMRCPRLIDWHAFGDDVAKYGYGSAVDAGRWIAAVSIRGLFESPLIDLIGRPMPAVDGLASELHSPNSGTLPAAA